MSDSVRQQDELATIVRKMTDDEIRTLKQRIIGTPRRAGSRARLLSMSETLALAALMAEEARRV